MFRRILVPLDGRAAALSALAPALAFARSPSTTVFLLRVVDFGVDLHDRVAARDYLEKIARPLRDAGVSVETLVSVGSVAGEIHWEAELRGADLIVMATHGRELLPRTLYGSVAEDVAARSSVPLLLVRVPVRDTWSVETILAPVDVPEAGLEALALASRLAREMRARLVLLHVVPPLLGPSTVPGVLDAWQEEVLRVAERQVEALAAELRTAGLTVVARTLAGASAEVIEQVADEVGADLLVMRTHGRTGAARVLLGSVTQDVVSQASCPVLIVRRGHPVEPVGSGDERPESIGADSR